jgi:hypothetical protein
MSDWMTVVCGGSIVLAGCLRHQRQRWQAARRLAEMQKEQARDAWRHSPLFVIREATGYLWTEKTLPKAEEWVFDSETTSGVYEVCDEHGRVYTAAGVEPLTLVPTDRTDPDLPVEWLVEFGKRLGFERRRVIELLSEQQDYEEVRNNMEVWAWDKHVAWTTTPKILPRP